MPKTITIMENNVPKQREGNHSDSISTRHFATEELAKSYFEVVKERLFDINHWHKYSGQEKAEFTLYDSSGSAVERLPQLGDFVKIDIPGPGNTTGDGFDWVLVEDILTGNNDHTDLISMRLRPAVNPLKHKPDTAHFFDEVATSNVVIIRQGNAISAEVHGRNEKPNVTDVNLIDKVRNTFVAMGGFFGASKIQWDSFTEGLIR